MQISNTFKTFFTFNKLNFGQIWSNRMFDEFKEATYSIF